MIRELRPDELRWTLDERTLRFDVVESHEEEPHGRPGAIGQERALSALELGLGIRERGFNIFVVGASGTGRTSTVRQLLKERAKQEPAGADVVLLYNFDDRDRPHAVFVPPSDGPRVKRLYENFVERMLHDLEKAFESEGYIEKRQEIDQEHQARTDQALEGVEAEALEAGFLLTRTGAALTLAVAGAEGRPLSEEQFEALSAEDKSALEERAEKLQGHLEDALRRVRALDRETEARLDEMARATADAVVRPLIDDVKEQARGLSRVLDHLDKCHEDILNRLRRLVPDDSPMEEAGADGQAVSTSHRSRLGEEEDEGDRDEPALLRYRVNVLVTRSREEGAPVVTETHPTASNLLGRIEQRVRGPDTVTDHTRVKAGAMYRANGGYLVLQAQDLLRDMTAWEGLKRAIKNRELELDDPGEPGRMVAIASLRPEPVPLSMKVCLIGTPDLYYALSRGDPDFTKLFKVKVDFDLEMDRSEERIQHYLRFLTGLAHEEKLLPLAPSGAARIIEHAARISHNQVKLTTRFGWIADLVREASFFAGKKGAEKIEGAHVRRALEARAEREGFLELRMREDIVLRRINIETEGSVIGQTNGLTVIDLGSYAFGMPVRITCRIGAGKGDIIDIEREVELGGPIHSKGALILRGLLIDRFGRDTPLQLAATLCIEQSYSDIDGDSASLAEACALFSSLAGVPLRQDVAMTGAIDQRGKVQAVGGVNQKVEGFFRVCQALGGDACHEVMIPSSNVPDLMLDEDAMEAAHAGRFKVCAVDSIEDAMEILTGRSWDKGKTPLRELILEALERLTEVQARAEHRPPARARRGSRLARAAKSPRSDDEG
jgi:lon-related putative ATP-dependent protease